MIRSLTLAGLLWTAAGLVCGAEKADARVLFKKTQLDSKFRSEGVAVGDFNHDGKNDIAAGDVYYAAPDWKMVGLRAEPRTYDPMNYSNSFQNFADDVNHDGWTDLIVVDFPGNQTWWLENPKESAGAWKQHVCVAVTNNESPNYLDVDGDGKRELLLASTPGTTDFASPTRVMGLARPTSDPLAPWNFQAISAASAPGTERFSHGLGMGDVNRDGRNDVLVPQGWWEAPSAGGQGEWKFHEAPFGEACANMYVDDLDGDGDNDVLSSAAHALGIWWHERTTDGWQTHLIDNTFSQTHAMCHADINGDGLMDFVTGKRYWAHGPKGDINPGDPAVMCWFELSRKDGKPTWTRRQFDDDSGIGTQFEVADVNGDGLLDVVTANKKGANYFQQFRQ